MLPMFFPFLKWRKMVTRETMRFDLVAGVTGAVVAMPQGVAFAAIAGMPPEYGLYSGMVPAVIAALFGSSWHLVSGPTTAASIMLFSILSQHAIPGSPDYIQMAITMTFLVGLIQFVMGILRLGVVTQFVSHSVVAGFTAGAAMLIATKQIGHFFGVAIPAGSSFTATWGHLFTHLDAITMPVLTIGGATLLASILSKRFIPKVPHMLVSLLVGGLMAEGMRLSTPETREILASVGNLPASLPSLSMPAMDLHIWREFGSEPLAVALLALTEAISIARAIGLKSGQRIDGNQEFIGQGLSNLVGCFFSSYVATGSFNRSGINYAAKAKTPLAAIFAGLFLALLTPIVAPIISTLPKAAMAAVLLVVAWDLIDFHHIFKLLRQSGVESFLMGITFLSTLLFSLEGAILLGTSFSLGFYLRKTLRPQILSRVPDPKLPNRNFTSDASLPECPQLKLMRVDGSLYYGAVSYFQDVLAEQLEKFPRRKHLAIIASGINFVDLSGAGVLAEEAQKFRTLGGGLYLVRVKKKVKEILTDTGHLTEIGQENFYDTKSDAIRDIVSRLDTGVCAQCTQRIFLECQNMPKACAATHGDQEQLGAKV
ncbi:MAG: SulP family inorganic anion transporter [Magnetococcus sp. THC-1_WYH]